MDKNRVPVMYCPSCNWASLHGDDVPARTTDFLICPDCKGTVKIDEVSKTTAEDIRKSQKYNPETTD